MLFYYMCAFFRFGDLSLVCGEERWGGSVTESGALCGFPFLLFPLSVSVSAWIREARDQLAMISALTK